MQIPDTDVLDQDETPEQYFEQLRKEYIEAWDSNDAVARHTLINERAPFSTVSFDDYLKISKLIVP